MTPSDSSVAMTCLTIGSAALMLRSPPNVGVPASSASVRCSNRIPRKAFPATDTGAPLPAIVNGPDTGPSVTAGLPPGWLVEGGSNRNSTTSPAPSCRTSTERRRSLGHVVVAARGSGQLVGENGSGDVTITGPWDLDTDGAGVAGRGVAGGAVVGTAVGRVGGRC